MNASRIYLIAVLLLAFGVGANGQEPPKAVLVDEFPAITCEDLSARLDNFFHELQQKPNAIGYIVLAVDSKRPSGGETFIDGYARWRQFSEDRFVVTEAKLPSAISAQLWSVPPGASLALDVSSTLVRRLKPDEKKKRLFSDYGEYAPCYTGAPLRLAAAYLKSEPGLFANVVIGSKTIRGYKKVKGETERLFEAKYSLDKARLRFYRIRTEYEPEGPEIAELWIVRKTSK